MDTLVAKYSKARTADETEASFASKVATITEPTGTGLISIPQTGNYTRGNFMIVPYGEGADNATLSVRVVGWRQISTLWVPTILGEVAATLSTSVGVAETEVVATERFADTLTLTTGTTGIDNQVFSPANNTPAHFMVDTKGCPKVEVLFSCGTATAANALVSFV